MIPPVEMTAPWSGAVVLTGASLAAALAAAPLGFRAPEAARATGAARVLGRWVFYALALALSLPWFAASVRLLEPPPPGFWLAAGPPFLVAAVCVLVGLRRHDVDTLARGEAMLIAATTLAFAAGLSLPSGQGAALVATLSLLVLGVGRIVRGSATHVRTVFVEGLVVVLLAVAARLASSMLEPALRLGAIVACVAAATVALVAFERRGGTGG
jgi:hypothetical protein